MRRVQLFLPFLLFIIAALFFYWLIERIEHGDYHPESLPSARLNQPLPAFSMPELNNPEQLITATNLTGQPALINIWATWCPSCYAEHRYLNQLAEQGVPIYGVNYKDNPAAARQWLQQYGDPYRLNILDQYGRLGLDLGVTGAPETYVIDRTGIIRLRHQGPLDERVWEESFAPLWQQLQ